MAQPLKLFNEESDSSDLEITINKQYANRYDEWRRKEEIQKAKDKLGSDIESSSSSESEAEDLENENQDRAFFKVLNCIMSNDPLLYDKNAKFFENENEKPKKNKDKKSKPLFMKDYERKIILEKNGEFSEDEEAPNPEPSYYEEQEEIKQSFKNALKDSDDNNLFKVREKSKEELKNEEADYIRWLKGQEENVPEETKKEFAFLHEYWGNPNLDKNEAFLRDYFLNKRYIEKDSKDIPTYSEIVGDNENLSDDEKLIEQQEIFEHKYNFRFEEPDQEFIKSYPRTIGDSLRRVDNKRKQKREHYAERKRKEKEQKREELKRLKAAFRREKLSKWKDVSGYDEERLDEGYIDSDFDPEKHDKKMQELFNDEYYDVAEDKKPEFEYDEEIDGEDWNNWTRENECNNINESDHSDVNDELRSNDNDEINSKSEFQKEMIESSQPRKKKLKKKSLFAKTLAKPKPVFDPNEKSFQEYLEEYYRLDYEDIIGDLPVKFKYRRVIPNSFGLTIDEILKADDKELNRWCSVKKAYQYRNEEEELYDVQAFKKKALNFYNKQKIFPSLFKPQTEEKEHISDTSFKKKKIKKINDHNIETSNQTNDTISINEGNMINQAANDKKKKKKQGQNIADLNQDDTVSINESNMINQIDNEERNCHENSNNKDTNTNTTISSDSHKQKSKKRKKSTNFDEETYDTYLKQNSTKKPSNNKESNDVQSLSSDNKFSNKKHKSNNNENTCKSIINDPSSNEVQMDSNLINNDHKSSKRKHKKKKKSNQKFHNTNDASSLKTNSSFNKNKFNNDDKRLLLPDERLKAYGINPKKFKNRIFYSKKNCKK